MHRMLLNLTILLLWLGGLVGFVVALQKLLGGGSPVEYGVLGIGGGIWLLSSAVCILIRDRID